MNDWPRHVRIYANKNNMSYQEASMNKKCKEEYQKKRKRMSPSRILSGSPKRRAKLQRRKREAREAREAEAKKSEKEARKARQSRNLARGRSSYSYDINARRLNKEELKKYEKLISLGLSPKNAILYIRISDEKYLLCLNFFENNLEIPEYYIEKLGENINDLSVDQLKFLFKLYKSKREFVSGSVWSLLKSLNKDQLKNTSNLYKESVREDSLLASSKLSKKQVENFVKIIKELRKYGSNINALDLSFVVMRLDETDDPKKFTEMFIELFKSLNDVDETFKKLGKFENLEQIKIYNKVLKKFEEYGLNSSYFLVKDITKEFNEEQLERMFEIYKILEGSGVDLTESKYDDPKYSRLNYSFKAVKNNLTIEESQREKMKIQSVDTNIKILEENGIDYHNYIDIIDEIDFQTEVNLEKFLYLVRKGLNKFKIRDALNLEEDKYQIFLDLYENHGLNYYDSYYLAKDYTPEQIDLFFKIKQDFPEISNQTIRERLLEIPEEYLGYIFDLYMSTKGINIYHSIKAIEMLDFDSIDRMLDLHVKTGINYFYLIEDIYDGLTDQQIIEAKRDRRGERLERYGGDEYDSSEEESYDRYGGGARETKSYEDFCEKYSSPEYQLSLEEISSREDEIMRKVTEFISEEITLDNLSEVFTKEVFDIIINEIDRLFFNGELLQMFQDNNCVLDICINDTCFGSVENLGGTLLGKSKYVGLEKKRYIPIEINKSVFLRDYEKFSSKDYGFGTKKCSSLLECILLIVEHELVHAIIECDCKELGSKNKKSHTHIKSGTETELSTGHTITFLEILYNRFGHTDFTYHT